MSTFNFNGNIVQKGKKNKFVNNLNGDNNNNEQKSEKDSNDSEALTKFISKGKLKKAAQHIYDSYEDNDIKNQALLLLGRLKDLENNKIAGTLTNAERTILENEIREAITILASNENK